MIDSRSLYFIKGNDGISIALFNKNDDNATLLKQVIHTVMINQRHQSDHMLTLPGNDLLTHRLEF